MFPRSRTSFWLATFFGQNRMLIGQESLQFETNVMGLTTEMIGISVKKRKHAYHLLDDQVSGLPTTKITKIQCTKMAPPQDGTRTYFRRKDGDGQILSPANVARGNEWNRVLHLCCSFKQISVLCETLAIVGVVDHHSTISVARYFLEWVSFLAQIASSYIFIWIGVRSFVINKVGSSVGNYGKCTCSRNIFRRDH